MRIGITLLIFVFCQLTAFAQNAISGTVLNTTTGAAIEGVKVLDKASLKSTLTDAVGHFSLEGYEANTAVVLVFSKVGELTRLEKEITVPQGGIDLGNFGVDVVLEDIETFTLNELNNNTLENDNSGDTYGLLSSGRDVFLNAVRYGVGGRRFRVRGMDSENRIDYLNGMPINKLHDGRTDYYDFGGLNDVLRRSDTDFGLGAGIFSFGGTMGSWSVDTRASSQRKQKRISYAAGNRSYRNRIMGVISTGMMSNGLAMTVSASHRWALEGGYVMGAPYQSSSYFMSVDKKMNDKHLFSLMILGSPSKSGRRSVNIAEVATLAGDNFVNTKWGYQGGKVRNAELNINHQPIMTFRHDWTLSPATTISSTIGYQFGRSGRTRLNWQQAADPRPDYYNYLPSAARDSSVAAQLTDYYQHTPDAFQIDWAALYEANNNSYGEVAFANGGDETVRGKKARYFIEENRQDNLERTFNTVLSHQFSDRWMLNGGLTYRNANVHYFNTVKDLLGADFVHDVDKFNISYANSSSFQPDVNVPNKTAVEGDIISFDFNAKLKQATIWSQLKYEGKRFDVFGSFQLSQNSMQRVGNMKNGHFPDNSFGEGTVHKFNNYGVKGGITYKINGRNYLYVNGYKATRAPTFRNAYIGTRTQEQFIEGIKSEDLTSFEGGYVLNSPMLKARVTGYYYKRKNQTDNRIFFSDLTGIDFQFGNLTLTGIDTRNVGTEIAVEGKLTPTITLAGVASIGQHLIVSRPDATFTNDTEAKVTNVGTVYWERYRVSNTPQRVFSARLSYNSPKFWFVSFTGGYSDDLWLSASPLRKTEVAVDRFTKRDNPERMKLLEQEELPGAFTLDFFGGKSFKFSHTRYLYLNLGMSNILNNKNIRTGGFEQLRIDPQRFPNKYFYSYGLTYYASVALRF